MRRPRRPTEAIPASAPSSLAPARSLARASSTETTDRNPLAHDGVAVLREVCRRLGTSDLRDCTFYGTAEPCPMCSAALLQTKIGRIVLGANGSAFADLLGPRAVLIEDLAVDYAVQPQVERGLESKAMIDRRGPEDVCRPSPVASGHDR
jgi:tRNA(adenine34) deaminase